LVSAHLSGRYQTSDRFLVSTGKVTMIGIG
jgi:hypothetical protein